MCEDCKDKKPEKTVRVLTDAQKLELANLVIANSSGGCDCIPPHDVAAYLACLASPVSPCP